MSGGRRRPHDVLHPQGCGGKDTPAICSDVEALKGSVADVTNVSLDKNSLATPLGDLTQVQSDLSKVKSAAKAPYATEIAALDQATSSVSSSLSAATASPSAQTWGP